MGSQLDTLRETFAHRHPATKHLIQFFTYDHLPERLQSASAPICDVAVDLALVLPDGPELTAGLRKLLEAKDCMVRALVAERVDA